MGCSRRGEQLPSGRGITGFENRKVLLLEVEAYTFTVEGVVVNQKDSGS